MKITGLQTWIDIKVKIPNKTSYIWLSYFHESGPFKLLLVVGRIPANTKPLLQSFFFQMFVSSDTVICDSDRIQARSFDCKSFITLFLFISFNLISWTSVSPNRGTSSHTYDYRLNPADS